LKVFPKEIATKDDILLGRALFEGRLRFKNKGPSCISCHSVRVPGVISGGCLAMDLTEVFSEMTEIDIKSALMSPTFPVMKIAYKNKALINNEAYAIMAFLHHVNANYANDEKSLYGIKLLFFGIIGAIFVFIVTMFTWNKRKRKQKSRYM